MSRLFGEVCQNGYVVRDIEAAMKHWIDVLEVGPWFHFARAPITEFRYFGVPSAAAVSIALANSGPLQIELIQTLDDEPSMYRDFLAAGREGLQHLAYWTKTFDADVGRYKSRGYRAGQSGCAGGPDGRFVYYATEAHPGTVIEVSEVSGPKGAFFAHIREAARTWNGSEPIRRIGG